MDASELSGRSLQSQSPLEVLRTRTDGNDDEEDNRAEDASLLPWKDETDSTLLSTPESSSPSLDALEPLEQATINDVPPEDDDDRRHQDLNRLLTSFLRKECYGVALLATLGTCVCMVIISIRLLYELDTLSLLRSAQTTTSSTIEAEDESLRRWMSSDSDCGSSNDAEALGSFVLQWQIDVLQNLVHASLLGGAALVTVQRGDVVWFFFCRNLTFYFGLVAWFYVVVDRSGDVTARWLTWSLAVCTSVAFARYHVIFRTYRRLLAESQPTETRQRVRILWWVATFLQLIGVIYTSVAWMEWFKAERDCESPDDAINPPVETTSILPLEQAYAMGAHDAFMLSLIMLAATFPNHHASVGGSILVASWRFLTTSASLASLVRHHDADEGDPKQVWSLVFHLLDLCCMLLLFVSTLQLCMSLPSLDRPAKPIARKEVLDRSDENTPSSDCCIGQATISTWPTRTFSVGNTSLFLGMTLECFVMLVAEPIGSEESHRVYEWGMHVAAMYLFCQFMATETSYIFHQARLVLAIACPTGSLVALWQIRSLLRGAADSTLDRVVLCLLLWRVFAGMTQTIGLVCMMCFSSSTIEDDESRPMQTLEKKFDKGSQQKCRVALYRMYIPSLIFYILFFTYQEICQVQLVWQTLGACETAEQAHLTRSWPAMGLFFHLEC